MLYMMYYSEEVSLFDILNGMTYFSTFNDHLTDGSHPEAPYNKLASDHGQIMAHLDLW